MKNREIEKLFKLANVKFENNFKYTNKKSKQDFIKLIRYYLKNNISANNEIRYEDQNVNIEDLKIECQVNVDSCREKVDIYNSYTFKSASVIIASILTSAFACLKVVNNGISSLALGNDVWMSIILLVIIFKAIDILEAIIKKNLLYEKNFYMICLKILDEL